MIISRKRAAIEKLISGYDKAMILKDINDIITEIKADKWPDNTPLFALGFATVSIGMTKQIPNWDTNPVVMQNLSSSLIGRFLRQVFITAGVQVDYSDQRDGEFLVKIATATDGAQDAACIELVGAEVHKYFKEHEHDETVKLVEMMCAIEEAATQPKQ